MNAASALQQSQKRGLSRVFGVLIHSQNAKANPVNHRAVTEHQNSECRFRKVGIAAKKMIKQDTVGRPGKGSRLKQRADFSEGSALMVSRHSRPSLVEPFMVVV